MKDISNKKLSFIIAFLYVGIGTIYSYNYWDTNIGGATIESGSFLYCLFFPVSFIPAVILFTTREPGLYVFITQTITFFLVWGVFYLFINLLRKESTHSVNTLKDFFERKDE